MAGQHVIMEMSPSEIDLWTKPQVVQMVQDSFSADAEKAKEAKSIIKQTVWHMQSRPLSLVQGYLGEDTCVDGGTIGEPVTQPEYVHILRMHLIDVCLELMMLHFSPPLTRKECTMLALANFCWYYFEYHD